MESVERALADSARSEAPFVTEAAQHVMFAGGKRFRPLLALLGAEFGPEPAAAEVVDAAVVVELTHVATLYHDDVMDEAALRRGSSTANARWDNSVAILTGDWLFARASDLVASLGPEAVRIQARTFGRLVEGQIRETLGVTEGQDPLAHYLSVVADKTGSLIATSVLFGARFAGAPEETQETLRAFGEEIGVAFQLADDILDVTSESGQSGKTPGTDLREGVPTLPVLIFRAQADPSDPADARLAELLDSDLTDDTRLAETLAVLRDHPSLRQAEDDVRRRADDARKLLEDLPEGSARAALESLCDLVVTRSV
ncbi:polyprenyl synthetase family protein [Kribbella sp. NPDC006257]|uniref:polyprenyl synthetase family protein n=1 Tax=Kribbella sp. NPDC006257 TaxID=3156738 RepID=UPI0033AC5031